ncbi:MAG TPA: 3-isopropylmalate dehydratase small subunit [Bacillota bacterium]|jgi:3-isopropylmalate/(R)-2-methylmalate dehydratase small subunit|nr:3-isopropylmalate dehydratase small subunit [Bacillota bacterium]HPZ59522.1 3-isopropylmalate dehydratase small subunit [Bacillota bacterium]HQC82555.1 3-isopropylmalate dehydratase small subunit [Bacillota bacterium]
MEKSKVWKFNHNVDTDQIIPSQYLLLPTIEEMKAYTFEPLIKDFAKQVQPGDVIIAGENFGCGSSREQAPRVLKELGVRAVIAGSFARIFFRNAINIGLPAIICKEAYDKVKQDDVVELDMSEGLLKIGDETLTCTRLPEYMQTILNAGGLIEFLNKEEVE